MEIAHEKVRKHLKIASAYNQEVLRPSEMWGAFFEHLDTKDTKVLADTCKKFRGNM